MNQTGTGKTYTILGEYEDEKAKGIIPRALEEIFLHTLINRGSKYEIQIAYLQIYMDTVIWLAAEMPFSKTEILGARSD